MTRLLTTLTVLSMAMLLLGCVRTSHSLSEVSETVTDDEIVGVWEVQDSVFNGGKRLAIEKYQDGFYLERDLDRSNESTAVFKILKVGDANYIECDLAERLAFEGEGPSKQEIQASAEPPINFFPCRWERRGEWIAIWTPDRAVVSRLLQDGRLTGRVEEGWLIDDINVTASAEELAACLEEHSDEIYGISNPQPSHRQIYRRVSAQVPAMTSESTRTP